MNLSRRGLWLAALILLLGVIAQWLPGDEGFVWRLLAMLWLAAVALEGFWAALLPITSRWTIPHPLRLGTPSTVSVTVTARARRALSIDAFLPPPADIEAQPKPQRLLLAGDGEDSEARLQERWTPLRLGTIAPAPLQLRLLGTFGLAWWSRRLHCDSKEHRVDPDFASDASPVTGRRAGALVPLHSRGNGTDLLELRDYQAGDPLRMLAWKASAKRGRLLVREFEQEQQLDLMIVIDAGRAGRQQIGALTRVHHAVNSAARLARHATALGDHVGLLVYDGRGVRKLIVPTGGATGLRRLHRELAALSSQPDDADPLPAAVALRRACPRRVLALWFTDVDTGADPTPLRNCAQLLVPRHLPLFAGLTDRGVKTLATRQPRNWKDPYISLAAVRTLDAAHHQGLALGRLGCHVVQAVPEEIDARLLHRYELLRSRHAV
jgi:uncharacterized protein (DUF58 family)